MEERFEIFNKFYQRFRIQGKKWARPLFRQMDSQFRQWGFNLWLAKEIVTQHTNISRTARIIPDHSQPGTNQAQ